MAFQKRTDFWGASAQTFIDTLCPRCPICGGVPDWTVRPARTFFGLNRYQFRCVQCGGILSAPMSEVNGLSASPLTILGYIKSASWHKIESLCLEIDSLGRAPNANVHASDTFSAEELRALMAQYEPIP